MTANAYFIFPATVTKDDTGRVTNRLSAALNVNDGTERAWEFDTTAEAKEAAFFWFNVDEKNWKRDDLGTLWSQ